jgi:hypothetical protein
MINHISQIIYSLPNDFKLKLEKLKFYFLDSNEFQKEIRKFIGYENFEVKRGENDVIGKVIKNEDIFHIFMNNKLINKNSIKLYPIKQMILHELSHVAFYDYSIEFNLQFKNDSSITSRITNQLIDLIDEYYAERKSIEIIYYNLSNDDIEYFKNKHEKPEMILTHVMLKSFINYISIYHIFNSEFKCDIVELNLFCDKLNIMYKNNNYDINQIFDLFMDLIDNLYGIELNIK